MNRSLLHASGLAALGLAWFVSVMLRRSSRLPLPERLHRCADDLQLEVYA